MLAKNITSEVPDFEALRARYAEERTRREAASDRQYRDFADGLSHIVADPYMISKCVTRDVATLEATAEAETEWVETVLGMSGSRRKFLEQCAPGFYNNEGRSSAVADRNAPYGAGPIAFIKLLRTWRERDDFAGFELNGAHARECKETDHD